MFLILMPLPGGPDSSLPVCSSVHPFDSSLSSPYYY